MTRTVEVRTPARLHFGLNSLGGEGRQFGGLGAMIEAGGVSLRVVPAAKFRATGPLCQRAELFARSFVAHQKLSSLPACHIDVVTSSPEHIGLGVGTQLGLAVAAGLAEWLGLAWRDAHRLGQLSGRGLRSAIGTHGFLHGGLLVDAGKLPQEPRGQPSSLGPPEQLDQREQLGQLAGREELPTDWRFVLIRQSATHGLAGEVEENAIDSLPAVPTEVTRQLRALIETRILPAARDANWKNFSEAIYTYGYQAGEIFAAIQGGPFASPAIAKLVSTVRQLGFPGVGQSSWGPTVFVVAPDAQAADALVGHLGQHPDYSHCHYTITQANNTGVQVATTK